MSAFENIPGLPAGIALNGTEQFWAIQQGGDVRLTSSQIGAYIQQNFPPILPTAVCMAPDVASLSRNYSAVYVLGGLLPGDGASGWIVFDGSSTATVDNAMVFPTATGTGRYLRADNGTIYAGWWYLIDWTGAGTPSVNAAEFTKFLLAVDQSPLHVGMLCPGTIDFGGLPIYWTSDNVTGDGTGGTSAGGRISAVMLRGTGMQNGSTLQNLQFHLNNLPPELSGHSGFGSSGSLTLIDLAVFGQVFLWNTDRANIDRCTFSCPTRAITQGKGLFGPGSAILNLFNVTHLFAGRMDVSNGSSGDTVTGLPLQMNGIRASSSSDTISWLHGALSGNVFPIVCTPFTEIPAVPASCTLGSITGNVFTPGGTITGTFLVGYTLIGAGITANCKIVSVGTVPGTFNVFTTSDVSNISITASGTSNTGACSSWDVGHLHCEQNQRECWLKNGSVFRVSGGQWRLSEGGWNTYTYSPSLITLPVDGVPTTVSLTIPAGLSGLSQVSCSSGTISGTVFTPGGTISGSASGSTGMFMIGQAITGVGVTANTTIVSVGSVTGTFNVSQSSSVSGITITASPLIAGAPIFVSGSIGAPGSGPFANSGKRMEGTVISYDNGTGALSFTCTSVLGTAGTSFTNWKIGDNSYSLYPAFRFGDSTSGGLSSNFDTIQLEGYFTGPNSSRGLLVMADKAQGPIILNATKVTQFNTAILMTSGATGLDPTTAAQANNNYNQVTQPIVFQGSNQIKAPPVGTTTLALNAAFQFNGNNGLTQMVTLNGSNAFSAPVNMIAGAPYCLIVRKTANGDAIASISSSYKNQGVITDPTLAAMTTTQQADFIFISVLGGTTLQMLSFNDAYTF